MIKIFFSDLIIQESICRVVSFVSNFRCLSIDLRETMEVQAFAVN